MERLADDDAGWARAAELLAAGRIVAIPTDTVYGIAAAIETPHAVARLFPLKERDASKPVAVLVADGAQAQELVITSPRANVLIDAFWPGALTVVAPRREDFEVDLGGAGETVGVRCPNHDRVRALCRRVGALATTSANRSGQPPERDAESIALALAGTEVAAVLDGGYIDGAASTVVRVDGEEITVLRSGPLDDRIYQLLAPSPDRSP